MAVDNAEFLMEQQRAVEQMRQMSRKSTLPIPPFAQIPPQKSTPPKATSQTPPALSPGDLFGGITERFKHEPDMALIAGLLLLLWSENADKKLLLALLYILF